MSTLRLHGPRAVTVLIVGGALGIAPWGAYGQFAQVVATDSRYAGSSGGGNGFNGDTGVATAVSLNVPSYVVFDSDGNLFVSDTLNNCVRRIDVSGNVSTVAGLRVAGGADTCDTAANITPTSAQGLLRPTGLAIDGANTLYIADSLHNCVRSLAAGAVDSFAANALATVAGTCSSVDTVSVTPAPSGLAVDGGGDLYVSLRDSGAALPVNQVVRHLAGDPATEVCYVAGQPSANVGVACAGISGTVTLNGPEGLAFDGNGDLFVADSGDNCVREVTSLGANETAVGQCANDLSGSPSATLAQPYGLAFSPGGVLYISEAATGTNNVVGFAANSENLTLVGGLPSGSAGAYSPLLDGGSALSAALNAPAGLATDAAGDLYVADSLNNVVREMSSGVMFPATAVGTASATQTITFAVGHTVNLAASVGADFRIASTTCGGALVAAAAGAPPNTCQATVSFHPSQPGVRSSALQLMDSVSGQILSVGLSGRGIGPLSLFTPGTVSSVATRLRNPIAVSVDSAGDAYVLEQGDAVSSADVLLVPAGGGAARTVVASGAGLQTPTAMAVDGAGNIFVVDAGDSGVTRFGADGTVNTAFVTGLVSATALVVDEFGNAYIAQAGAAHNVVEVYASGTRRVVAGSGAATVANGVPAAGALLVAPSSLALGPGGLSIADAGGHLVYTVDGAGTIHVVAGNGSANTSAAGQALGTGLLWPNGLAADAAGDLYVSDEAANRIYEVYAVSSGGVNISTVLGSGVTGYSGDGGPGPAATMNAPNAVALDGSGNLFVADSVNGALRELEDPVSPDINFGHVVIGTTSPVVAQDLANVGNVGLTLTTPFTTTDAHYAVSGDPSATTCASTLAAGAVCGIGFSFTPAVLGPVGAQSNLTSNFYNSPQTIQLNGYGLFTQNLPYTLPPESEVYGHAFTQTAALSLVYPDLVPSGTMAFTLAGETTCAVAGPFPGTVNCAAPESGVGVGVYLVNFAYTSGDISYSSATGATTLRVTPAALSVTPANESKILGAPVPALPGTIVGAANGDVFLLSDTTTATAASLPGTYPITPALTPVGLATVANYTVTYNTGTLTVVGYPLTITVNNATRAYGAANPVFTGTVSGAVNGDTFTVTYSTVANAGSPVGGYGITATVTGANLGEYSVTVAAGTLTVTPIPLTVTVGNAARSYGAANPSFSSTISGAINGDMFTNSFSTLATVASPVGTYPIDDVLGGSAAVNYAVTVVPGVLTITATGAALMVVVNNVARAYGGANPVFSGTVTGLLNGDTVAVSYATAATAASVAGSYAITATVSGAALANYSLSVTPGTLSIGPAATVTTITSSASPVYVGTMITFIATVSSSAGVPPGTVSFLNGTALLGTGTVNAAGVATFQTSAIGVGSYSIVAMYPGSANFAASSGAIAEGVNAGSFVLAATPQSQYVRGPSTTTYAITATSMQNFAGSVGLSCSGLPADASCAFTMPTLTVTTGGVAGTSMTVVNTEADAQVRSPGAAPNGRASGPGSFLPARSAGGFGFGFGLTALIALFGSLLSRRGGAAGARAMTKRADFRRHRSLRLMVVLSCTASIIGLAGCACFTSAYMSYNVVVTGTNSIPGSDPQSITVVLSVGQ